MAKAVFFDVDGTLIDSVDLHAMAWLEALAVFDHPVPFADIRHQIGKGGDQLLPVILSRAELDQQGKQIETRRGEIHQQKYLSQARPFPQVRELFQRIRAESERIALAASAKGDELAYYKHLARIDNLVETETTFDDVDRSKPHPDIFQAALKRPDSPPVADVVVAGDSPYDAEGAAKAGVREIVGVLGGGFPEEELRAAGCMVVYRDPEDLLERYSQSPLAGEHSKVGTF